MPGRVKGPNRDQISRTLGYIPGGAIAHRWTQHSRQYTFQHSESHLADPGPDLGCPGDSENDEMRVRQLRSRSTTSETHRDVSSAAAMVNFTIFHPAATTPTAAETTLAHPQTNQQNSTRGQEWYDSYNSPADERFKTRN